MALTPKRDKFCRVYVETDNASEAYRSAFDAKNMKAETIHKRASELLKDGDVKGRIDELRAKHMKRHELTIDDLIRELEEARKVALEADTAQASAAISATMGKAKLLGFGSEKIDHNLTGKIDLVKRIVVDDKNA